MTTPKRAELYVKRNKKRTILLFLLLTVLLTISLLGMALRTASGEAVKALRSSIGGYFTIQTGAEGTEHTDEALLEHLKTLDHISKYNGIDTYYLYTDGLNLLPGIYHGTGALGEFTPKLIACLDTSLHERFLTSSFQLIEGRQITADDQSKAIISKEVAQLNGLTVGDTFPASTMVGLRDWRDDAESFATEFEIVGIYQATRSEPVEPGTPECDLQENIIFTDIHTAKQLYAIKFPDRTPEEYRYSSGFMLFVDDPVNMAAVVENMEQQPYANWDGFVISQNSAAYQQAAAPIQKAETISFFLLIVILIISIGILALILLLWTRERITEIGILVSLGISSKCVFGQMLLENYMVAVPAFVVSVALSALLPLGLVGVFGTLAEQMHIGLLQACIVLACAAAVIFVSVFLASLSILRKNPRDILIDLS